MMAMLPSQMFAQTNRLFMINAHGLNDLNIHKFLFRNALLVSECSERWTFHIEHFTELHVVDEGARGVIIMQSLGSAAEVHSHT